jgi:hypothetical protein
MHLPLNRNSGLRMTGIRPVLAMMLLVWGLAACVSPPEYPLEPVIEFVSVNQTVFDEGDEELQILFDFTDGDGDIGSDDTVNVSFVDSRAPDFEISYKAPLIDPRGNIKAISGSIQLNYRAHVCLSDNNIDTVVYSISISDRAGNESNVINTPQIFINCD